MMNYCASQILKHSPASLTTYALAVKRCSAFFPTIWGVMTEAGDRPYFLLKQIPNNRLNAGANRKQPPVHIRLLAAEHTKLPPMPSTLESIDRVTWSDRLFQMRTSPGTSTYVLERGAIVVGFLTLHMDADQLTVAEVVVDPSHQANGYGGILMRFAETLARQADCRVVRLNAIREKVAVYEGFGFAKQPVAPIKLDDEEYHPMERLVLYHQGHRHVDSVAPLLGDVRGPAT
jgi:GNAT superfamily N-acetyltransferase